MGVISTIKRWINMIFSGKATEEFNVKDITSGELRAYLNRCAMIYQGRPYWLSDSVKTVNFAKTISSETAKLATLAIGITVDGSSRAEWLQKQIDEVYYDIRTWVEWACAYGTIILKPNGVTVDAVLPDKYMVTDVTSGKINGIVFVNNDISEDGKTYYTRLEYHRFLDNGLYCVTNKCFTGATPEDASKPVPIEDTPWVGLDEEVFISNLEKPLYAVLKTPGANIVDKNSPLSLPIYEQAIEELKDLDVAYSRNSEEIYDSQRVVLLDADKLLPNRIDKKTTQTSTIVQKRTREQMELPKYVRNVMGNGEKDFYQEINPSLNTATRKEGINYYLSQIGFKCGFSNGYFVFDEKTGMITATQVEADDRRTINTIKDVRDKLESAITDLLYAMSKFADLYALAPVGNYEVIFDFGDITYNVEEDRLRWMQYANGGYVPKWKVLEKFEGMSEEDAKALVEEAAAGQALYAE